MFKKNCFVALCMVASLGSMARGSDLYNTTSTSAGLVINPWNIQNLADAQFFKTTTDHVITSVESRWGPGLAGSASGTVSLTINTDNAGVPGSVVGTVGAFDLSLVPNTVTLVTFTSLSINLSPNTNYWLVFQGSNVQPGAGIQYAPSPLGTGSPFTMAQNSGSGWTTFANLGIIGQITATANVPEPSTYALAGIAGLVMTGIARRRKAPVGLKNVPKQMEKSHSRIIGKRLVAPLCLLLGLGSMASGADIFKSQGTQFDGYWSLAVTPNVTALAQAFQTDANHVVNMVSFDWVGQNATGTVTVSIAGDNAGVPGAQVSPVGSFNLAPLVNLDETFITFSSLNINLATNSNYWIVFTPSNLTGSAGPVWTSSPTGTAPFTMASNDISSGWTTYANKAMLGQISASVPEPTTYATAAISSCILAWVGRRRRGKS